MTDELVQEFEREFWPKVKHKVAKLDALKAFAAARKLASCEAICAGQDRYVASKPAWQEWAYPASWLRAGRWLDEVGPAPAPSGPRVLVSGGPSPRDLELIAAYERGKR